jgi:5-methylcytosine-specific restriction endonuclease McrA
VAGDKPIISRAEAKALGLKRYFTGKPCRRGHIVERYVSIHCCIECHRLASAARGPEYQRAYFLANREKLLAQMAAQRALSRRERCEKQKEYYIQNREKVLDYHKGYRVANREKIRVRTKLQRDKNPERIRERQAACYVKYREERLAKSAEYRKQNPEKKRVYEANRKARKRAGSGKFTPADVAEILHQQRNKCGYCQRSIRKAYHIDHIMPLSRGGSNARPNIQLLCPTCNMRKNASDPLEFARKLGKLL